MQRVWGIILVVAVMSVVARGDGKFFSSEKVPVGVPYQRAILIYKDGKETLILQSQYETDKGQTAPTLAWVVPVPAVPELASMDAGYAKFVFRLLGSTSRPLDIPVLASAILLLMVLVVGVSAICYGILIFAPKSHMAETLRCIVPVRFTLMDVAVTCAILAVLLALTLPVLSNTKSMQVVKAEDVGIYDVKVIKGDSSAEIVTWLKENGYAGDNTDVGIFEEYVRNGWCFVVAKVNTKTDPNSVKTTADGLAAPLILRFSTKQAVYPMRLTATAKSEAEILLYVLSTHKMTCSQNLALTYAGMKRQAWASDVLARKVVPDGFFADLSPEVTYVCKFKGKLKPEQMKEDIIFTQAKDDKSYRKRIYRW